MRKPTPGDPEPGEQRRRAGCRTARSRPAPRRSRRTATTPTMPSRAVQSPATSRAAARAARTGGQHARQPAVRQVIGSRAEPHAERLQHARAPTTAPGRGRPRPTRCAGSRTRRRTTSPTSERRRRPAADAGRRAPGAMPRNASGQMPASGNAAVEDRAGSGRGEHGRPERQERARRSCSRHDAQLRPAITSVTRPSCRRRCRAGRASIACARRAAELAVGDDRELVEQVDRLLRPAHEVAGRQVGVVAARGRAAPRAPSACIASASPAASGSLPGRRCSRSRSSSSLPQVARSRSSAARNGAARQAALARVALVAARLVDEAARQRGEGRGVQVVPEPAAQATRRRAGRVRRRCAAACGRAASSVERAVGRCDEVAELDEHVGDPVEDAARRRRCASRICARSWSVSRLSRHQRSAQRACARGRGRRGTGAAASVVRSSAISPLPLVARRARLRSRPCAFLLLEVAELAADAGVLARSRRGGSVIAFA